MAKSADLRAYVEHVVKHAAESGQHGAPHFSLSRTLAPSDISDATETRWARRLDEPLWGRTWLLLDEARVVGHLDLRGGRLRAEMHRAVLAMGIQMAFTGRGHGMRLMQEAVAWARDVARLSWIDLGVFATNTRARKLYARAGFVETGFVRDAFRIDGGVRIDDVPMTLSLVTK
jgi:RimJ/RimL family protein N-acetyltransferase